MEVKPDSNANQPINEGSLNSSLQPKLTQVLQSKEILYPVIDNLKLSETWSGQEGRPILSKQEAYGRLLRQMKLSIRATDMIEIGAFSSDRNEAANIANMTAVVYQKVMRDDVRQVREAAFAQLREQTAEQGRKVEDARKEMLRIAGEENIADPKPEEMESFGPPQIQRYLTAKSTYIQTKRVLEEAEKRLASQSAQLKMQVITAKIWEKAEPAIYSSLPNVRQIMALAGGLGLVLGVSAAGLFLYFARRG
jgi:hypothetical protein